VAVFSLILYTTSSSVLHWKTLENHDANQVPLRTYITAPMWSLSGSLYYIAAPLQYIYYCDPVGHIVPICPSEYKAEIIISLCDEAEKILTSDQLAN
jgi:hypothetical protein